MKISDCLTKRRTVRLYDQRAISRETLEMVLEAARNVPSAANLQRLRYVVVQSPALVRKFFPLTAWAKLVEPRRTPVAGVSAPTAFILICSAVSPVPPILHADAGAAAFAMQAAGYDLGLGSCWLGSVDRGAASALLQIPAGQEILYAVAFGYPAEQPVREDISAEGKTSYYLDEGNLLHVPKFTVDALTTWK